ncbi:MAG TPA: acetylglutamate kinase [Candidatus Brocadiia bacterium]|nr:acetylglutamate kinase [Candidatus Brocadiia bacterium]
MDEAMRKADALIEALPYIQAFHNKFVVIKLGGAAMEDDNIMADVMEDVVFLNAVGAWPVVVHGGGPHISAAMKARGLEPTFVAGLRITDAATLDIAVDVLVNEVNAGIRAAVKRFGGRSSSCFSSNSGILKAVRTPGKVVSPDGSTREVDIGFVGKVVEINTQALYDCAGMGEIPVIPPIGRGADGQLYNVNADTAAAFVAGAIGAEKIVYLSNVHGILRDPKIPDSYIPTLTESEAAEMIRTGAISGGMLPKTRSCVDAIKTGVRKAHIIDGRMHHSLLLEIFTDKGVGTQILK